MVNKNYLTVKEVSEILGISRQAIYKRMKTDLSTYVIEVDNTKYLKYKVLEHFFVNNSTKKVDSSTEFKVLKKMVEILEKENELKQQTIERLETRNEEEHRQLIELTNKVGITLQSLTQGQLAAKLIEGKKLIDEANALQDENLKKWYQFWK
jgi:hypothetical protein